MLPLNMRSPGVQPFDLDGYIVMSTTAALPETLLPAERPLRHSGDTSYPALCLTGWLQAPRMDWGVGGDGPSPLISTIS